MSTSYNLTELGSAEFENLVNHIALKILGAGTTGFGPSSDGGRDGYFEGEAPYPSISRRWKGIWYIQSKFHAPHLSTNPQKWLIEQVKSEIKLFKAPNSGRVWPNNWIIASNIEPSGKPETGSFDAIKNLVNTATDGKVNIHVWGGRKIIDFLSAHTDIAQAYGHFLTPGHVISKLYDELTDSRATVSEIIHYLVVTQFVDHTHTKLDQAGSTSDERPNVQDLFIDLPYHLHERRNEPYLLRELISAASQNLSHTVRSQYSGKWRNWTQAPKRARTCLLKGGPGQGKSTIGQYLCQISRAKIILEGSLPVSESISALAKSVQTAAIRENFWPTTARIPVQIELKEYAHWFSTKESPTSGSVLTYLAEVIKRRIGGTVHIGLLQRALQHRSWIFVFDGLDEVPNDLKDSIAKEILYFLNDQAIRLNCDLFSLCTSRPQGYSGQFSGIDGPSITLAKLNKTEAIACATPLLKFNRNSTDIENSIGILNMAIQSANVQELMTTPLQSHIMAIVIRDGGRPPERRWQLFNSFYFVMKKRESMKNFRNPRIAKLLREEDRLLKSVHMRLGFILHARAENSDGAQTTLSRSQFRTLVEDVVKILDESDVTQTVNDVMEATTERLVLVSTPDDGNEVRFDIRQLQEFFAAEFLHSGVSATELGARVETIGGDAHWREVIHFLLSALIENQRAPELAVAIQNLVRLNEGGEGQLNPIYCRRTGRAALIANRLLQEGVLEQDQRDRLRVRPLLSGMGSLFNLYHIQDLGQQDLGERSKTWLAQLAYDKINTANQREALGALAILGWVSSPEIGYVNFKEIFFSYPFHIQNELMQLWIPDDYRIEMDGNWLEELKLSKAVIALAVDILNSEKWLEYDLATLQVMVRACTVDENIFFDAAKQVGIQKNVASVIFAIHRHKKELNEDSVDFGLLQAIPFKHNWESRTVPPFFSKIDSGMALKSTGGYFKWVSSIIHFAKNWDEESLKIFNKEYSHIPSNKADLTPGYLLALAPVISPHGVWPDDIPDINKIENNIILLRPNGSFRPIDADLILNTSRRVNVSSWKKTMKFFPKISINFAANGQTFNIKKVPKLDELIDVLLLWPDELVRHILSFGRVEASLTAEQFSRVKDKIGKCELSEIDYWSLPVSLSPFRLKLPEDAHLLQYITPALLNLKNRNFEPSYLDDDIISKINEYGIDSQELETLSNNCCLHSRTRAAARALLWVCNRAQRKLMSLADEANFYRETCDRTNRQWFAEVFLKCIIPGYSEKDEKIIQLMVYLMEETYTEFGAKLPLIMTLNDWQERSEAPITKSESMNSWLNYRFVD